MIETVNIVIDVVSTKHTVKALFDLPREDAYPVIDLFYWVCPMFFSELMWPVDLRS